MQKTLKEYLINFIIKYKLYFVGLTAIVVFAAFFDLAVNYKVKEIIDIISSKEDAELGSLLALFVLYKLMSHFIHFFTRLLGIYYKPRIVEQSVKDIYRMIIGHSLHWFDSHLAGEISSKISDFQTSIATIITHTYKAFGNIMKVFISLVFLIYIHNLTALVLGIFIMIYSPIIYFLLKRQMELQENYVKVRQKAFGIMNDSMTNIFAIKIIGNIWNEFKVKLSPAISAWRDMERVTREFDAYFVDNADTIMVTIMNASQIYLLAYLYQNGEITAGDFAFVSMVTLSLYTELDNFLENLLFNINPSIAQIRTSYAFVSQPYDVVDRKNAKEMKKSSGKISYQNVDFIYGNNKTKVLNGFNLEVKAGERLGIVGTSGAGKTTLIKSLLRYFDVSKGGVFVDDHNISDITQDSLRKNISIIPQDITMFHRSIKDNLKIAKHNAEDQEIIEACKKARIHDDIIAMEKGYDSIVGERGVKLSGGQRQRVAIARAILKNAPILILDEATSSLDTPTETLIQKSIDEMLEKSGSTVIAIAHRLSTLKHMDRIIVLDKGKIMEEGTHNGLLKKKGLYYKLYYMQAI